MERLCDVDRVLAGHGVDHQEGVIGADRLGDLADLLHERLVDGQAACGVDDDDVAAGVAGLVDGLGRDLDRIGWIREDGYVDLATEGPELLDRGRALEIGTDQQWIATLALEPAGQLGRAGGLTGALQAGHHDDGRRLGRVCDLDGLATEAGGELLVDDLDDLLSRIEGLMHLFADCTLANTIPEVLDHRKVYVGLQQGDPDFTKDFLDVGLGKNTFLFKPAEDSFKLVCQRFKHSNYKPIGVVRFATRTNRSNDYCGIIRRARRRTRSARSRPGRPRPRRGRPT